MENCLEEASTGGNEGLLLCVCVCKIRVPLSALCQCEEHILGDVWKDCPIGR